MKKNRRKIYNIIFYVITFISLIILGLFCFFVFKLNMLPMKYLILILTLLGIIYSVLLVLIIPWKIKLKFKVISCIFLVIFDILFGFGIKYISDTINFFDDVSNDLSQKEEYQVMILKDSSINNIDDLKNKKIGVYNSVNSSHALDILLETIKVSSVTYSDVVKMFEDLENKEIDAVLINNSISNLLESDLSYMNLELKNIHSVLVPIKEVDIVKVVDVTNTPFNVYIAGGDAYGTIDKVTNTDVNMIVTVDPVNRKLLLTSIPRDYYVNLPSMGENVYDKLTHAGYYGIGESVLAVEKLLGTEINYYAKVNFSTIEGIVDAIGGVDVYVDFPFTTSNKMYTFNAGNCHMDGKMALRFARERKVFSNGDIQRVKNQQKVLTAAINKVTSSPALITGYSKILESVSSNFSTNLDKESIARLVKMQLNDMRGWQIENQNLIGTDFFTTNTYTFPNIELYTMKQDTNSVTEASNKIKQILSSGV